MRIVGGKYRGRRLDAPAGRDIRPTAERAREGAFNILAHAIEWDGFDGLSVLDVFAGTGALGLEALSRGAARAVFVDSDKAAIECLRGNAARLGETANILSLKLDASRLPPPPIAAGGPFRLVFLDAPYGSGLSDPAISALAGKGWLATGATLIVETGRDEALAIPHGFDRLDQRAYGAAAFTFLEYSA